MSRQLIATLLLLPFFTSAAPLPEALLNGLLGHGHRPTSSGAGLGLDATDYTSGTGMGRPSSGFGGMFKRNLLGGLGGLGDGGNLGVLDGLGDQGGLGALGGLGGGDAGVLGGAGDLGGLGDLGGVGALGDSLGPLDPILDTASEALEPVTGPLSPALKPLAILGIDVDLLTPTDLLCARVEGEFINKAYALGCVCLGQDGLLLTAEAGVEVIDGLVDWINAEVNVAGFHSMYPEYGIPTCDKDPEDDGGEFRCPLGKERKANGKCAAILIASPPVRSTPSTGPTSSASPAVTPAEVGPTPTPAPTPTPEPQAAAAPPPASAAPSTASTGPAPSSTNNDAPVAANSSPVDNDDGEDDLPYCDEVEGYSATDADDSGEGQGDGEWVQVTSMTSTETVTIPATAFVQMQTETVTITSTSTVTSTSTSTMTETKTETVNNCQQTFAAAAAPANQNQNQNSGPAPAGPTPGNSPAPIDEAAAPSSSPSTPAPTPTEDDDAFRPTGIRLNSKPRPTPACPPGQVMGATMCCRADMIERNGECGCKDGFQNLIDLCVEICLPPLTLVGGKCLKLDLGIAQDLTKDLGLGAPTDLVGGLLGNTGGLPIVDSLGGLGLGGVGAGEGPLGGLGLL